MTIWLWINVLLLDGLVLAIGVWAWQQYRHARALEQSVAAVVPPVEPTAEPPAGWTAVTLAEDDQLFTPRTRRRPA